MIGSIGFSSYLNVNPSSHTLAAAKISAATSVGGSVKPVEPVPEVYSNAVTTRIRRSPSKIAQDNENSLNIMNAGETRNAEDVNAPFKYLPDSLKPAYVKEQEAEKAERMGIEDPAADGEKKTGRVSPDECETCKNRKYVDGSNEGNVSFKTPGHISPEASASVVSAHEHEHVANAIREDQKEGVELVSVSVSLHTAVCPECGTTYVSGGTTRTIMRHSNVSAYEKNMQNFENSKKGKEKGCDLVA